MVRLVMDDIIEFYDGIQLAYMVDKSSFDLKRYIATHSVDDGVYLAARVSQDQKEALDAGLVDVKSVMMAPHNNEWMVVLDPLLLPLSQQDRMRLDEYCGIPVQYEAVFEDWAIPDSGLFITDIR